MMCRFHVLCISPLDSKNDGTTASIKQRTAQTCWHGATRRGATGPRPMGTQAAKLRVGVGSHRDEELANLLLSEFNGAMRIRRERALIAATGWPDLRRHVPRRKVLEMKLSSPLSISGSGAESATLPRRGSYSCVSKARALARPVQRARATTPST